ncbi:MAG: hypothetical protein JST82_12080, partial [Bacteroidetes bacterium]|nr:hypothetical protein [Bacteroidota bacterium]
MKKCSILLFTLMLLVVTKINAQVSLTATTGTTSGSYSTLAAAFAAINAGTHTGAISISITGNTTETSAAFINASGAGSASYSSIAVKAGANNVSVSGALNSLVILNGASNITIDGHNPANTGTPNSRDLSFINTSSASTTGTAVIRLGSTSSTGSTNNIIKNCIITGNTTNGGTSSTTAANSTEFGIFAGQANNTSTTAAPSTNPAFTTGPGPYTNTTIQNNLITTCATGIYMGGNASTVCNGLVISGNTLGGSTSTNYLWGAGICLNGCTSSTISGNTIQNIINAMASSTGSATSGGSAAALFPRGIDIATNCSAVTISGNKLINIQNSTTSGYPAKGIHLQAGNNHVVYNNFISGVMEYESGSTSVTFGAFGIFVNTATTGHTICFNSIYCYGTGSGSSAGTNACIGIGATSNTGLTIQNNIFNQSYTPGYSTTNVTCIYWPSGGSSAMSETCNNNAYFLTSTATNSCYGMAGTTTRYTSLAALKAYSSTLHAAGTNDNASQSSTSSAPFASSSDLHINGGSSIGLLLYHTGVPVSGITTDIDGTTRNVTTPSMGAHEFVLPTCWLPNSVGASSITSSSATISWSSPSGGGSPVNYEYVVSTSSSTPSGSGTATTSTSVALSSLASATTYYIFVRTNCGSGDYSAWTTAVSFTTLCGTYTLPKTEGFNASTSIPICWSSTIVTNTTTSPTITITSSASTGNPTHTAYEGANDVKFNSFNCGSGAQIRLNSPDLNTTGLQSVDVNFYWLNDNTAYLTSGYNGEGMQPQYSTNGGSTWTDFGSFINRFDGLSTTYNWVQYTYTLPLAIVNQTNAKVGFLFTSKFGDNCYMDSVAIYPTTPSAPTASNSTQCISGSSVVPTCSVTTGNGSWAGHTYKWYTVSSGGTAIAGETGSSLSTYTVAPGVTTFYVSEVNGTVESSRTAVTATVNYSATVSSHPATVTICQNTNTSFSVAATAYSTITYQWQESTDGGSTWINLTNTGVYSNVTTTTLNLTNVPLTMNGRLYRAVASGTCSPTNSNAATLNINSAPVVTTSPSNTTACPGSATSFTVAATGAGLTYQWQFSPNGGVGWSNLTNSAPYSNVTTATLGINPASVSMNGYLYRCLVNGTCSPSTLSGNAMLTVNNSMTITQHPISTTVCVGVNASFTAAATGSGITYQWQESTNGGSTWNNLSASATYTNVTSGTMTIVAPPTTMNGYMYRANVGSACTAPANTNNATLTVNFAPSITSSPSAVTICEGTAATMSVTATGSGLSYQWQYDPGTGFVNCPNAVPYVGLYSPNLNFTNPPNTLNGYVFRCSVTGNCAPTAISGTAALTVYTKPAITSQPATTAICLGSNASFSVSAIGTGIS